MENTMNQVQKEHRLLFDISTVIRTCLSTLEKTDTDRIAVGKSLHLFLEGSQKEAEIHIVPEDILDSLLKGDLRYCADILQQIVYKYGQVYTFPYMYLKSFSSDGKLISFSNSYFFFIYFYLKYNLMFQTNFLT